MRISRRTFLGRTVLAGAAVAALPIGAQALNADEARTLVRATMDELLALLRKPGDVASRAASLRDILERRAAVPQIARFVAGRTWREMSDAQQEAFVDAYVRAMALNYARRFSEFDSTADVAITNILDAGKKGMLVQTPLTPQGQAPVDVDWLISDRGGSAQVVDLVIAGISMAATQRDEIAAMLAKNNNDIDALIEELRPN